ncbi:MAG: KTSC domain-containing protein [Gammaproteobacteria bacterium]|jgi:hypothetical protein|nr:KTSC domain-containing protein [Gammaproteobacteria bacterium]MBT7307421.1 KTSC domain-containing protein [Gammaproteobacteria bacterium]
MDRTPVGVSGIVSAGYRDKDRTMEIEFKNGKVIQYYGVIFSTYDKLMFSETKGRYFKENIKGRFEKKTVQTKKSKKKKKKKKKKRKKGKKKKIDR